MSLRLCVVVPSHWEAIMGGSQYQAKILIEHLLTRYDVEIFYLTTRADPSSRPSGYQIVPFARRARLHRLGFFVDAWRLYRTLRRLEPDAVLQLVGCAHTGIAAFYGRRHGCPMLWRVSSDRSVTPQATRWWRLHERIERRFLEYGIRNARLILAQTRHQQQQLIGRFGCPNVVVLPNFHPVPDEPAAREPEAVKRILWVANLKPLKNPAAFVRLARRLSTRTDTDFVMIGRAMAADAWTRELLADIEATPNLRYLGSQSQERVNALLEDSDLLVNTSEYEGFSNTFIQAWMRRVPVVSLRVDPDQLLSRGGLGALSRSEDQLREDVVRLLDATPAARAEIGSRCRRYALSNHSEANADRLAALLGVPVLQPRAKPAEGP